MPLCSLTCTTTYFFVPDPLIRYTLSQRNKFVTNPDGSVDSYLQAESPGEGKEPNRSSCPSACCYCRLLFSCSRYLALPSF